MRTLIVDDDSRFAGILKRVLAAEDLGDVDTSSSAEEALERLRDAPFDVVVTDLRMPGMSGLDLLAELRRAAPGTDVILMTAFADRLVPITSQVAVLARNEGSGGGGGERN